MRSKHLNEYRKMIDRELRFNIGDKSTTLANICTVIRMLQYIDLHESTNMYNPVSIHVDNTPTGIIIALERALYNLVYKESKHTLLEWDGNEFPTWFGVLYNLRKVTDFQELDNMMALYLL